MANDTRKTYLYTSEKIEGPWKKQLIEGFYHDGSLLFDEDGRNYIVYGLSLIHILEENLFMFGNGLAQLVWGTSVMVKVFINIFVALLMSGTLLFLKPERKSWTIRFGL